MDQPNRKDRSRAERRRALTSRPTGRRVGGPAWLAAITILATLSRAGTAASQQDSTWLPPPTSPPSDLALNPTRRGYPHPLESDSGWGGGRDKWDIIDGHRWYPGVWNNGLAFTGGLKPWIEPCGWRQATIDFGRPVAFDSIVVWHNHWNHVPRRYRIQVWDGRRWRDAYATEDGLRSLRDSTSGNRLWNEIIDASFPVVTATKVRFRFENCERPSGHGWIMELEVYGPGPVR